MIHGLDTGFLVAAEVREHAEHADARDTLARLLGGRSHHNGPTSPGRVPPCRHRPPSFRTAARHDGSSAGPERDRTQRRQVKLWLSAHRAVSCARGELLRRDYRPTWKRSRFIVQEDDPSPIQCIARVMFPLSSYCILIRNSSMSPPLGPFAFPFLNGRHKS